MKLLFFLWFIQVHSQTCSESSVKAFTEAGCDANFDFGCDREDKEKCAQKCMDRKVSFEIL